jgi:hypothetical protein
MQSSTLGTPYWSFSKNLGSRCGCLNRKGTQDIDLRGLSGIYLSMRGRGGGILNLFQSLEGRAKQIWEGARVYYERRGVKVGTTQGDE